MCALHLAICVHQLCTDSSHSHLLAGQQEWMELVKQVIKALILCPENLVLPLSIILSNIAGLIN